MCYNLHLHRITYKFIIYPYIELLIIGSEKVYYLSTFKVDFVALYSNIGTSVSISVVYVRY